MPQEFSSPEFNQLFQSRWDAEAQKRTVIEERERTKRLARERYLAAEKAAESFLPPEYRKHAK